MYLIEPGFLIQFGPLNLNMSVVFIVEWMCTIVCGGVCVVCMCVCGGVM